MTVVSGRNRVNRPYFFTEVDGNRAEFPSFGTGTGDLEGNELRRYNMLVDAKQIDNLSVSAPVNTALPTITGTAQVGETLTATTGTWTGSPAPEFAYTWEADGTAIEGATSDTYVIQADDLGKVITVTVTATNDAGSASATSDGTDPVVEALSPPVNENAPTIAGTPQLGETLTATDGDWSGNPTPTTTRVWQRSADGTTGWSTIAGATDLGYTLVADDVDQYIRILVTATNSEGSADAPSSDVLGPVLDPEA